MKIIYLTSNKQKFEEAQHILTDWDLERVDRELQEIQGSREEIIIAKAKQASQYLKQPLIVEDVSVTCEALNGFPGPYIKDFLKALGDKGLATLVHKYDNHRAQVICMAAYIEPNKEPIIFEGILSGTIVPPHGTMRHGTYSWNPIFQPEGCEKTMGELSMAEHAKISMRCKALLKLKTYLEQQGS